SATAEKQKNLRHAKCTAARGWAAARRSPVVNRESGLQHANKPAVAANSSALIASGAVAKASAYPGSRERGPRAGNVERAGYVPPVKETRVAPCFLLTGPPVGQIYATRRFCQRSTRLA